MFLIKSHMVAATAGFLTVSNKEELEPAWSASQQNLSTDLLTHIEKWQALWHFSWHHWFVFLYDAWLQVWFKSHHLHIISEYRQDGFSMGKMLQNVYLTKGKDNHSVELSEKIIC